MIRLFRLCLLSLLLLFLRLLNFVKVLVVGIVSDVVFQSESMLCLLKFGLPELSQFSESILVLSALLLNFLFKRFALLAQGSFFEDLAHLAILLELKLSLSNRCVPLDPDVLVLANLVGLLNP